MNISIIIPNYNGKELLEKNLPAVKNAVDNYLKEHKGKIEIVVVDDASLDESVKVLSSLKYIRLLRNEKNHGFSSAVNRGVRESIGEIFVLLNSDVAPDENFLSPLVKHFDDEKIFAVGCMDRSIEGNLTVMRGRGLGQWKRGLLVHRKGDIDETDTFWVNGGSGCFRRSIWNKLGGFNELYRPFYWEDIDISYRAMKSGFKIFFEPKSVVTHFHEKGAIKNKFSNKYIETISYRNQILFVWLNITDRIYLISHAYWIMRYLFRAIVRFDTIYLVGFFQAVSKIPQVLQSRSHNAKTFIRKDKEVLAMFK